MPRKQAEAEGQEVELETPDRVNEILSGSSEIPPAGGEPAGDVVTGIPPDNDGPAAESASTDAEDMEANTPSEDGNAAKEESGNAASAGRNRGRTRARDNNAADNTDAAPKVSRGDVINDMARREVARRDRGEARQAFITGWNQLLMAMRRHIVIEGTIIGITRRDGFQRVKTAEGEIVNAKIPMVCADIIVDGKYFVTIPFDELFVEPAIDSRSVDMRTEEGINDYCRRQEQMAKKMVGINTVFCVKQMDTSEAVSADNHFIIGSRKEALLQQQREYFIGVRNRSPRYKVGDTVPADIISVGHHAVNLCVGGAEVRVPIRDLTYRYVDDAIYHYTPGDKLTVRIKDITVKENGHVSVWVSCRPCEREDALHRAGRLARNTTCQGVMTRIVAENEGRRFTAYAWLYGYEMPARVVAFEVTNFSGVQPKVGDRCLFIAGARGIDPVNLETGIANVRFYRTINS